MSKENLLGIFKQFKKNHEPISKVEKNHFLINDRYGKYEMKLIKDKRQIGIEVSNIYLNEYHGKKICEFLILLNIDADGNFVGVSNPESERPGFFFTFKYKDKNYNGLYEQDLMTKDIRLVDIDGRYWKNSPQTETQQSIARNMRLPIIVDPYAAVFKLLTQNVSTVHVAKNPFSRSKHKQKRYL